MSVFIRCQWMPSPSQSMSDRFLEVANVASASKLISGLGPRWFQLGRSRKDALKREVHLDHISTDRKLCRRVPLTDGEAYWALQVWNGRSEDEEAGLRFSLFEPPTRPDGIGVDVGLERLRTAFSWSDVLAATRQLAESLGGCAIVTSHELREEAARRSLASSEHAAYAAFWGLDRSGRNSLYRWLRTAGRQPPTEVVACDSWDEVNAPDAARLRVIADRLAAVAEASDGLKT